MKPLFVLIITFVLSLVISRLVTAPWQTASAGNIAMCIMLCFTAFGHFKFTRGMELMIPEWIPFKRELVYLTGVAEIVLGLALLFPSMRPIAGILLILFFILMLPANIKAALNHINFETAGTNGKGPRYLRFRIPLQVFFIGWVLYFAIYA